ncbi:Regulator of protease activity HflC, stomatin/prohibitin superfamily [Flexibacter flexilis DSM 6793]|uniref:Regulator of protease activity HflC, stomatin/prohibitin superfamily n=1 Tax=Flexibacter flexilis DSM 6793 TaxID=927664 RepID=A0A1I1E9F1_9BACT|nr:slipin family protein [Flexibacter flexilis]SFB81630.1 Regulator of protease activity HflC, stomatin/prohibitin superfamily [Flexibacter flexilis DSM 6793]
MLYPIIVFALVVLISGIRVAQEYQRAIVFRLGRFNAIKGPGLYWIIPIIERQQVVDIRTKTVDLEQQETITKDSVTIKVNAVLWFKIINPEGAILKVVDYNKAVYQFSVSALRNIIGQHTLDEVLREREQINATLQKIVDQTTEPWGVKIEMVEMKDVEIPEGMQRAMAREAEAIREKRARMVKAEAELDASIKLTQGAKEMEGSPIALELRRMQMLSEIGIDNNTTTIVLVPSDFSNAARSFTELVAKKNNDV